MEDADRARRGSDPADGWPAVRTVLPSPRTLSYPCGISTMKSWAYAADSRRFLENASGCIRLPGQCRMRRQSEQRDHLDLQINLLAEQDMTLVLRLLRHIAERLGISPESEDAKKPRN